jgi:HK97 family phage prohead protease
MEYLTVGFNPLAEPVGDSGDLLDLGELPENAFRGVASVFGGIVDAWIPTIIHRGAFTKTLQESARGVKILWQHNTDEPIGLPMRLFEGEDGLVIQGGISRTQRGRDALILLRDQVIDAMSIGFDTIKETTEELPDGTVVRHIHEVRLWEISLVTFGADPNARILEVNKLPATAAVSEKAKINTGRLELQVVQRFLDLPLSDRGREWDASAAKDRVRTWADATEAPNQKYAKCWVFWESPGDEFGQYKLPIADLVDGILTAIPRGIFAAAAAVQGARGGLNIPEDELPAVQRHLGSYYRKMRKKFDDDSIVAPWELGEDAEPVTAALSHYTSEDKAYLVGTALVEGRMSPLVASAILALDTEAESGEPLTPIPVDALELQLLEAELAMSEAFTAAYPQEQ